MQRFYHELSLPGTLFPTLLKQRCQQSVTPHRPWQAKRAVGDYRLVFTTPPASESNFSSTIQGTWKYIFSEWFPNSGYEFDGNGVDFELYDERFISQPSGVVCEIYIPVAKRQSE